MEERQEEQGPKKEIEVRNSKANDYRTIFVHQFYGGEREDHFEMVVESLQTDAGESQSKKKSILNLTDEVCLKMTPEQAKKLYLWLGDHLAIFEKKFREIKIQEGETIESTADFHPQNQDVSA